MMEIYADITNLFTSQEGLYFISLIFLLNGLIAEILGVAIILSVDYSKVQDFLSKVFDFNRIVQIRELRERINERKIELRSDPDFNSEMEFRVFELQDSTQEELLVDIIFSNRPSEINIQKLEFIAKADNPQLKDIVLRLSTDTYNNLQIEDDQLERWVTDEINRRYYKQGALLILMGFILIFISALLELVRFLL